MIRFLLIATIALGPCASIKIPQKSSAAVDDPLVWWEESIIYQVYPRSHMDSDEDGIGDLLGIESKVDYFVDIGVGAVWISPIYKSPMIDFGYDISNFTDIEPMFGNMSTFKSLSDSFKQRNIKLIMDFVPNHSSDQHPWFDLSVQRVDPYTDYYVWKDPKGYDADGNPIIPNNWVSVFGGSMWEWHETRQQFYLHQFVKEQPDFNYENPKVIIEMLAAVKFWLDVGVDGFRVDAVPHLFEDPELRDEPEDPNRPPEALPDEYRYWRHPYTYNLPEILDALAEFRKLMDIYTATDGIVRCMMVEATLLRFEELFAYFGTDDKPIAHFPFNFEFIYWISKNFTASDIHSLIDEYLEKLPEGGTPNWLVGNHDNHRIANRFGEYVTDLFNMIIHLLPGSSVTYYGEELGMQSTWLSWEDTVDPFGCNAGPDRYEQFSRDPARTPMQWDDTLNAGFSTGDDTWLPLNENYTFINVNIQNGDEESHLEIYKKVSQLRKSDAWKYGSLETNVVGEGNVFAFTRIYNGIGFVVLANFGDDEVTADVRTQFEGIPDIATVYTKSSGFVPETTIIGDALATNEIIIGAQHSLILQF